MEKYKEKIMTIFFFCHYLFTMVRMQKGADGYFTEPVNAYYVGCNMTIYEAIVVGRIPRFDYQILFSLAAVLVRFFILRPNDLTPLVFHIFLITAKLSLEKHREVHNKHLFRIYFNSKEQLVKFKNLVVHDFPQGIAILHKNLRKYLFINDTFKSLNTNYNHTDIRFQLDQFILKQSADGADTDASSSSSSLQQETTLLALIKKTFLGLKKDHQKLMCTVDLRLPEAGSSSKCVFGMNLMDIIWDDEPTIAIIARDITQQHKMMSLKIADAQKDFVLATVSHELRTPLNGMLGMIQIIEKKIREPEFANYLLICKNSGTLLLSLVNSILDLNQIRANKFKLYYEKIDIYNLLMGITALFEFQCSKKGISLKVMMHPATPKMMVTDKNRLSQILINLVGNALKFTSHGGIIITASKASDDSNHVNFSVEDTGIGIKEEDQEKLFSVFGKVDNEDAGVNRQGVGLGLNISNNLVRALSDKEDSKGIKVESEYGKGSKFSFTISSRKKHHCNNAVEEDDDNETQQELDFGEQTSVSRKMNTHLWKGKVNSEVFEKSFETKRPSGKLTNLNTSSLIPASLCSKNPFDGLNHARYLHTDPGEEIPRIYSFGELQLKPYVLIVDDNPFNVTVAENMITSLGFQVKSALSGEAAVNLLSQNDHRSQPIKIIFMDCQMPVMDGYETTRTLREKMKKEEIPDIPVIALTANDSEKDKEKCKKVEMSDYLTKPLNEPKLKNIILKYTTNHQS